MARTEHHLKNLGAHCLRFRQILGPLVHRTYAYSALMSRQTESGSFRSPRQSFAGVEREFPRSCQLDDDPSLLDFSRIDLSLAYAPAWALLNGSLRVTVSSAASEVECIVLIDLSRSMLSDTLAGDLRDPENPPAKLASLYAAVGSVIGHAEACGFKSRVLFLQADRVNLCVSGKPRDIAMTVLRQMSQYQTQAFETCLREPNLQEPFRLAEGCAAALARRASGVVVIISDFLDPLNFVSSAGLTCDSLLQQVLKSHRCIAIDLAQPEELSFPKPHFWDLESQRVPCRLGARHLERGMEARFLRRKEIQQWNRERAQDRLRLSDLLRQSGTEQIALTTSTFQSAHGKIVAAFDRLR